MRVYTLYMDIESDKTRTERKKEEFLADFEKMRGLVSPTADRVGISRQTFYNWMKTDPVFRKKIRAIEKTVPDMMEDRLKISAFEGNIRAQIYYLEHSHKKYKKKKQISTGADPSNRFTAKTGLVVTDVDRMGFEEKLYKLAACRKMLFESKRLDEFEQLDSLPIQMQFAVLGYYMKRESF